jgi:hypothetical protein
MTELTGKTLAYLGGKIGRCSTCMRQSLTAALIAWGTLGLALLAGAGGLVAGVLGLAALGLSALWLAHIAAFATREQARADTQGRREALGFLARAAAIGAAVSIPVATWSSAALAFCGQCTQNSDCGPCCKCVNTAPVNSGKVCNECKPK